MRPALNPGPPVFQASSWLGASYDPDQAKYLVEVDGRRKYCRERSMVLVAEPGSQAPTELPRPEVLPPSMVEQISLWTKRMRQQLGEQLLDSFGPI